MIPFHRHDTDLVATFAPSEVVILHRLASEITDLLGRAGSVEDESIEEESIEAGSRNVRALGRLLPPAYRDGGANDAEFRRFTRDGLIERKTANATALRASLSDAKLDEKGSRVTLDADASQSWLRGLTDIRLTLAAALGITQDSNVQPVAAEDTEAVMIYGWLGYVQESLLDALDG